MPHVPDSLHADHDPLLVAAYAAGDATGPALDEAMTLVATCTECATLHHDLRAIAAALPTLPAPVRPRDFSLTAEQAASLRPAGWRRLLAPLAGPRFAFAGPLGTGLATLGIAGLLVAGSLGTPAAAPMAGSADGGGVATSQAAASSAAGMPVESSAAMAAPAGANPAASPAPAASAAAPVAERATTSSGPAEPMPAASASADATPGDLVFKASEPSAPPVAAGGGEPGLANGDEALVPIGSPEAARTTAPAATATPVAVLLSVGFALVLVVGIVLAGLRLLARRATGAG